MEPLAPLVKGGNARLVRDVHLKIPDFEVQPVRAGSTWHNITSIDHGEVYKPIDTVLMADDGGYFSGHRYEANLVVFEGRVTGIYLPTEKRFVPNNKPAADCLTGISK
jgi:hypothetical protein